MGRAAHRPAITAHVVAAVVSAALTVLAYPLWLGWHESKHRVPGTTSFEGPLETWQVVGLAVTLGLIAAVGGWLWLVWSTVLATALAVTFMFALEATTNIGRDTSLWPVGAAFLLGASLVGLLVVALVFQALRRLTSRSAG